MAVTSIWTVKSHVGTAINYIINPEKTTAKPELSPEAVAARQAVGDVIDYAVNPEKTEQMMYVTGINCNPDTALDEFMDTKWHWGKTDGRLAYHGYQSFLEGEGKLTAEQAHEIGVKLAQEVWGDRFEVVVATHLNTDHYHNHFLINSVSFMDGYKYRRTKDDYRQMRAVNDRLCREYKLHVVEDTDETHFITVGEILEILESNYGISSCRKTIYDDINMLSEKEQFKRVGVYYMCIDDLPL